MKLLITNYIVRKKELSHFYRELHLGEEELASRSGTRGLEIIVLDTKEIFYTNLGVVWRLFWLFLDQASRL